MILLFWLQVAVSTCKGSSRMADCASLLSPPPPSLYEQYCCIPNNRGKKFKTRENNAVKFILCPNHLPSSCERFTLNCLEFFKQNVSARSGYYTILSPNGSLISVYCDMEGSNCDGKEGWMKVGYLNMSEPGATCPSGLTLKQFNNIDHGVCGRPMSSSIIYSAHGIHYSEVCGQISGYQFKTPDGFPPLYSSNAIPNIENCNTYVDGVTITYGSNPRKHIWTYACGVLEAVGNDKISPYVCPCNNDSNNTYVPEWINSDYYCESGQPVGQDQHPQHPGLYSNDLLWDGHQCGGLEGPCCINPKMPWFIKTLNETTNQDIEVRVCGSENPSNEDVPVDIIKIYIR